MEKSINYKSRFKRIKSTKKRMDIKEAMAKIGELENENQSIMTDMKHMKEQNKELEDKMKNEKKCRL